MIFLREKNNDQQKLTYGIWTWFGVM